MEPIVRFPRLGLIAGWAAALGIGGCSYGFEAARERAGLAERAWFTILAGILTGAAAGTCLGLLRSNRTTALQEFARRQNPSGEWDLVAWIMILIFAFFLPATR